MRIGMELTEKEVAVVNGMRRERQRELERIGCRPGRMYPYVLREERGVKVVKPDSGKHSGYAVYVGGELLCLCMYRKGAYSVMDYLIKK